MAYEDEKFAVAENVSYIESVVRASVSIAVLVAVMLIPSITSFTLFSLTQLAIYLGLTAFTGWDPIYALTKKSKAGSPEQVPAAVAPHPQHSAQPVSGDHKRAA